MAPMVEISVIMPAYNHERFIAEAIESVLCQTHKNLELIIVNDGSTDKTEEVIREFNDPRIRYYHQDNQGAYSAHNRGIQLACGEYISIINSDDVYHRERLEILLETARTRNSVLLITDIRLIDQFSNTISDAQHWWIRWHEYLKTIFTESPSPLYALLAGNYTISTSNFFFRSDLTRDIGLFSPYKYILDYDFAFRAVRHNPLHFTFLTDKKLLSYRLHGQNTIIKNPLIANYETFHFLTKAIKAVFGPEIAIPVDHLNKIKRYITKELILRHKHEIRHLREELLSCLQEMQLESERLREVEDTNFNLGQERKAINPTVLYNKKLLNEYQILKNSLSFRIGRFITFPLRALKRRSQLDPVKATVKNTEELKAALAPLINDVEIISFDIFDTIFERDIDPPDKVKEVVARRLAEVLLSRYGIVFAAYDLLKLRDSVELSLRHSSAAQNKDFECRYKDIVRGMVIKILGKDDELLAAEIVRQELEIENEVLYVKKGMEEILDWLKKKGKRIIAVSDMYLDREHIRSILDRKSLSRFFDSVYVSSELSLCKYSGNLFKHVLLLERTLPKHMIHIGDNKTSDHKIPAKMGIHTLYFKDTEHLRRKYVLKTYNKLAADNPYWRGKHLLQLIRPLNNNPDPYYRYSFSLHGPVYATFIYGVIETVKKHKIRKLFFLAREGELFLHLFNIIAPHFLDQNEIPEVQYVYLTRKSTALASAHKGLALEKALIPLYNPKQEGISSIFTVFGLPPEEFAPLAAEHGFINLKDPLHDWNDERLTSLLKDKRFQDKVRVYAQADRVVLEKYLKQIGFFDSASVAFVDIGWNATIQKFIQDTFADQDRYPHVYGLYLGFHHGMQHQFDDRKNTFIGYIYDTRNNNPAEKILCRFEEIFEEGARALHPTTVGYREDRGTGSVGPIFKEETASDRLTEIDHNEKIEQIRRAAVDFSHEFVRAIDLTGYSFEDLKPFILTLIERCIAFPTSEEARTLLELTHSEDFGYDNVMDFSTDRIKSPEDLLNPHQLINKIKQSNWVYGTARSSGIPGINFFVRLYDILRI